MKNLTLTQNFALLALDAQQSGRMTVAKRAALRGVAACTIAELLLDSGGAPDAPLSVTAEPPTRLLYQQTVLNLLAGKHALHAEQMILSVTHLRDKQLRQIERTIVDSLMGEKLLDRVVGLLSCDVCMVEAGVDSIEYRTDTKIYNGIVERLRAEVLEDGELTDDAAVLLWLLRECGVLGDLFSDKEWSAAGQRMLEVYRAGGTCGKLMPLAIHRALEHSINGLLHAKTKLVASDVGLGLNFLCPVLERSQVVFIEVEGIGDDWVKRVECLAERLRKLEGRVVEFVHVGKVPLVKIDNVLYEAVPDGISVGGVGFRVPVYGLRLRRYPTFQ